MYQIVNNFKFRFAFFLVFRLFITLLFSNFGETQKKATAKYNATHYKHINLQVKEPVFDAISDASEKLGLSKIEFITRACLEYIKNHIESQVDNN